MHARHAAPRLAAAVIEPKASQPLNFQEVAFFFRALCLVVLLTVLPVAAAAANQRYPDVQALPPSQLLPQVESIDGEAHHVLRFTAQIVNVGSGPLEVRGDSSSGQTRVFQRVFDDAGGVIEFIVGNFIFHPAHNHWHLENFAAYELWTRANYDAWLASGRQQGQPGWQGSKTTGLQSGGESFCLRDSRPSPELAPQRPRKRYRDCDSGVQGLSAGWIDQYSWRIPEQWIDLGTAPLPDGDYVLRVVADPLNQLVESPNKADPARESTSANEGVTFFSVQAGCPDEALLARPREQACPDPNAAPEVEDNLAEEDPNVPPAESP